MQVNKIPVGKNPPEDIYVVVEIPANTWIKYELDKESGAIFVDRVLFTSMRYPFNYGFIPQTLDEDGDPLDVLVISDFPVEPGSVIRVRPIGMLNFEDEAGVDAKIIALPHEKIDPTYKEIADVTELPDIYREKIKHFFEHYKDLEPGKWVKAKEWHSKDEALKRIQEAIKRYQQQK